MTPDGLAELVRAADALYRVQLARMTRITADEERLRRELAELDQQRRDGQSLSQVELSGMREVGADIAWQGWTGRMRQDLQTRLALVLVQKSERMHDLRHAFGKKTAAEDLLQAAVTAQNRVIRDRRAETIRELSLLRAHQARRSQTF